MNKKIRLNPEVFLLAAQNQYIHWYNGSCSNIRNTVQKILKDDDYKLSNGYIKFFGSLFKSRHRIYNNYWWGIPFDDNTDKNIRIFALLLAYHICKEQHTQQ